MKKFLMVLSGETYRHGPQGSRSRGTEESFKLQDFASKSHLQFIENLKNKFEISCEVLLFYYKLNEDWDQHFESLYAGITKSVVRLENLLGEETLHPLLLEYIRTHIPHNEYEFVLFIRPDLYLKKYFTEIFEMDPNQIKFANVCEMTDQSGKSYHEVLGFPQVNHQIFYVPQKFYEPLFQQKIWKIHASYIEAIKNGIHQSEIGFFLNTYHSSSTSNTWNPIFHQVGREETQFWVDYDYVVDDITHQPKKVEYDNRYSNLDKNDFVDNYYG